MSDAGRLIFLERVRAVEPIFLQAGQAVQGVRHEYGRLVRLAGSMLRIGAIGFGGGNALIPVIEAEVVQRGRLVSKRDYEEDVIAACITPGALPVEIAAGIGQRIGGFPGMLLAASMMALPGALLTVLILSVLTGEQGAAISGIRYVSVGLGAFIISLLVAYVLKSLAAAEQAGGEIFRAMCLVMAAVFLLSSEKNLYALLGLPIAPIFNLSVLSVLGLAFFLISFLGSGFSRGRGVTAGLVTVLYLLSGSHMELFASPFLEHLAIFLMAVLGLRGLLHSFRTGGEKIDSRKFWAETLREIVIWLFFVAMLSMPALMLVPDSLTYLGQGFLSSLLSFGGGDAYLTIADGIFVQGGTTEAADFYGQLVPVANALPGSILCKILTGIGYLAGLRWSGIMGGFLLALAGFAVSVAASGLIFGLAARLLRTFHDVPVFRQISLWVRPIISGLLLNVALSMLRTNLAAGSSLSLSSGLVLLFTLVLAAICLYAIHYRRSSLALPMALAAGSGLVLALI